MSVLLQSMTASTAHRAKMTLRPCVTFLASIPCDIHSVWKNPKEPQRSIYADTGGKEEIDYESRFNTIGWNIKNENSECFF